MPSAIGMIIALPSEAARITGRGKWRKSGGYAIRRQTLPEGVDLLIAVSGMGIENARRAAEHLIEKGVSALVNAGVSGGLAPGLQPGDLVIAKSVLLVDAGQIGGIWQAHEEAASQAAKQLADRPIPPVAAGS